MTEKALTGRTLAVLIATDPGSLISTRRARIEVSLEGFVGDRHYGFTRPAGARERHYPPGTPIRNNRQVTILSEEELEEIAADLGLPNLEPEWIGGNLLLSGIPGLTQLPVNTRMIFASGAVLVVQGENHPCTSAGRAVEEASGVGGSMTAFPRAAMGKRGLLACVERAGEIGAGDEVIVRLP